MTDINIPGRVNAYTVNQFIAAFCQKHKLTKSQLMPCASAQTKAKLMFARHPPIKKQIPDDIVIENGIAIGRRSGSTVIALTIDDIDACKFAHIPFSMPHNLYGNSEIYTEEIKNYVCDKDYSDSESESD